MDETLQKLIGEYYAKLPVESQRVISDMKWRVSVEDIGKKYGLRVDQIGNLGTEILLALLGITHQDEFGEMIHGFGLDDEKTNEMTLELEKAIFWPIREQLMEVFTKNTQEEITRQESQKIEDLKKPFENPFASQKIDTDENKVLKNSGIEIIDEKVDVKQNNESLIKKELEKEIANPTPSQPISLNEIKSRVGITTPNQSTQVITPTPSKTEYPGLMGNIPVPIKKQEPTSVSSMVSDKLTQTVSTPTSNTNYGIPKMSAPKNIAPIPRTDGVDPYREQI